jgi:hypothetical protein
VPVPAPPGGQRVAAHGTVVMTAAEGEAQMRATLAMAEAMKSMEGRSTAPLGRPRRGAAASRQSGRLGWAEIVTFVISLVAGIVAADRLIGWGALLGTPEAEGQRAPAPERVSASETAPAPAPSAAMAAVAAPFEAAASAPVQGSASGVSSSPGEQRPRKPSRERSKGGLLPREGADVPPAAPGSSAVEAPQAPAEPPAPVVTATRPPRPF